MQTMLMELSEDFKSFRESTSRRLNYLEDNASPEVRREAVRMQMEQEIQDFRHGR